MKSLLRILKLFVAFFLLFSGLTLAWFIHKSSLPDITDRSIFSMVACFAISLTILWTEWKKN